MYRQLRLLASLVKKDWKLFLADRRAAALCFVVPIVLASAFGLIFDRPSQRMNSIKLPLVVANEDDSPFATAMMDDLIKSEHVDAHVADRATAELEIERRVCGVAMIIPSGFGEATKLRTLAGEKPAVVLLHHPMSQMESQWAEGVLTEVVMKRAAQDFLKPLGLGASIERPFTVARQTLPSDQIHPFNSRSHSFSGMTVQYLLFWGMECGLLLLRERQRGIWRRLRIAPAPLFVVLLGRALSTSLIALLQIATTFGFGCLFFGVTISGSVLGFVSLAISISVLAAGVGLLVASIGRTEASARSVFIVVILAVSMLGGLWLPAFLLPKWVQEWSLALPTTWAMRGLDGVTWQGRGFAAVWPSLVAVNLFALAFLVLALIRFGLCECRRQRGEAG